MRPWVAALVLASALSLACAGWASELIPGLRFDPFQSLRFGLPARPTADRDAADAAPAWSPRLRATLISDRQSLVNVDGELLAVGDAIQGYTLVRIEERQAVLERGGERRVLSLDANSD
ncbi:MAG: hypothetical protein ACFCVA_05800 [Gammaproteobacteria bacterium]